MAQSRPALVVVAALALLTIPWGAVALAEEQGDTSSAASEPATVVVKLGPVGDAVKAKGTIVPAKFERAACEPKVYGGPFEVAESAPEGPVVKGQTLLRFKDDEYEEQLIARERSFVLARIKLQKAELDARLRKDETAVSLDDLLRKQRLADEALERFETVERKLLEEGKIYSFEGRRIQIQNMREELAQLEKMYTEDDLTEETEEIVLKRNKRSFERMLQSFERAKKRHEYDMKVDLPRRHERLRMSARKARNSLLRFQETLPLDEQSRKLGLEKARADFAKAEEAIADFRADRDSLTVKAPMAGYAVRGSFAGTAWKLASPENYEPGKKVLRAKQTLYTVVEEGVLRVKTSIQEADLAHVKVGQRATVKAAITGEQAFEAEVAVVARYGSSGKHAVTLRMKGRDPLLRTGLACSVEIPKAAGEEVLSVPAGAIGSAQGKSVLYIAGEDGEPERIVVKVIRTSAGRTVIEGAVQAGQRVLASPPKEEK